VSGAAAGWRGGWAWGLACVAVVALLLRLALAARTSYFGDEIFSLEAAQPGLGSAWASGRTDVHPPLFNLLLALWLRAFPALPEWRARLLPIAIGLLWMVAAYRLAVLSLTPRGAMVAAAIVGLHPMAVLFTEPLRWYGLLALLVTMSLVYLQRALRWARGSDLAWLALWNALLGWTDAIGLLIVAASMPLWLGRHRWTPAPTPWRRVAASYAASALAVLPPVVALLPQLAAGMPGFDRTGLRAGLLAKPAYLAFALTAGQTSYPWDPVTLTGLAVFLAALVATLWRQRGHLGFSAPLAIWLPLVATSALVVTSLSAPHYYLALLAGVALLVGWISEQPGPAPRIAVCAFATLGTIGLVHLEAGRQFQREEFLDPWREIVTGLRGTTNPGDLVLFSHGSVGWYGADSSRFRKLLAPRDLPGVLSSGPAPPAGAPRRRILAVISPLSGAQPELNAIEHWLGDSLAARGYALAVDSGLVRSDAAAARRRFSGRPFPEWRVRLLEWRLPGNAALGGGGGGAGAAMARRLTGRP
jgi:hypothetical protein